jgi:hypothetical protein
MKHIIRVLLITTFFTSKLLLAESSDNIKIDYNKYKSPITKGDVIAEIKSKYSGRVLSISKDEKHGVDCHIAKLMTPENEFKVFYVQCNK